MKQAIIKLVLPTNVECSVEDFRALFSGMCEQNLPFLFNRDEKGETINTQPRHRWIGRRNKWVGFVSEFHDDADNKSHAIMPYITGVVKKISPHADVKMSLEQRTKVIDITGKPFIYRFSRALLKNRTSKTKGLTPEQAIERMVTTMLAKAVDDELLHFMPDSRDIKLKVFDTHRSVVKTHGREYSEIWSGEIAMNVDLRGYWQMGQMQNKGFGMLFKDMRGGQ